MVGMKLSTPIDMRVIGWRADGQDNRPRLDSSWPRDPCPWLAGVAVPVNNLRGWVVVLLVAGAFLLMLYERGHPM